MRIRFTEWGLLVSHETGRRSPAKASEQAGFGCPGKFQTGRTCFLPQTEGKADNPKEALCSWNSDSALTPMSLEEIYSPLAVEIVCLPFPSLQNDRGRPDVPQATCSSTRCSMTLM